MPTTDPNGTTSADTLHGWKEIANHLGRSTRAVQRWEIELRLPVHRLKGAEGQTVYALRNEIDEWKKSRDLPKNTPEDELATGSEPNGNGNVNVNGNGSYSKTYVGAAPELSRRQPTWLTLFAVAAATLAGGLLIGLYFQSPRRGPVTEVQIAGTSVTAFDQEDRMVWRTEMGAMVARATDAGAPSGKFYPYQLGTHGDIVLPVRFGPPGNLSGPEADAIVSFDSNGKIRWKRQASLSVACGSGNYVGPWTLATLTVSADLAHPKIWAAFNHNTWWPGFLLEIDAEGRAAVRYVQNGWIRSTTEFSSPAGHFLAVAGVLNEFERASTAILNLDGPPSASPHTDPQFNCADLPAGQPTSVTLWPELDTKGLASYAMAVQVKKFDDGLQVLLDTGGGDAIGELDLTGHVRSLLLADNYWMLHRQLEAQAIIKHPAEECPERTRPKPIETWTPGKGWTHTTITPTVHQPVQTK